MSRSSRALAVAVCLLHLGAAALPCPPDPAVGRAVAAAGEARQASAGAAPPPCHADDGAEVRAPCPCGCEERASGGMQARLGFALPRAREPLAASGAALARGLDAPATQEAPPLGRDPIPI